MAKAVPVIKTIDVSKKLAGLDEALSVEEKRQSFEFQFYGKTFKTLDRIPAVVIHKTAVLTDEDSSSSEQLEALMYSVDKLIVREDRRAFVRILEDEGVEINELFTLYGNLVEAMSSGPLDTPSSASTGSKKTSKSSMGTLSDGDIPSS